MALELALVAQCQGHQGLLRLLLHYYYYYYYYHYY